MNGPVNRALFSMHEAFEDTIIYSLVNSEVELKCAEMLI